jgi:hypothetical protein
MTEMTDEKRKEKKTPNQKGRPKKNRVISPSRDQRTQSVIILETQLENYSQKSTTVYFTETTNSKQQNKTSTETI